MRISPSLGVGMSMLLSSRGALAAGMKAARLDIVYFEELGFVFDDGDCSS